MIKNFRLETSISSLFLISIIISVYLSPMVEGFFGITALRPIFFLSIYFFAIIYFFSNIKKKYDVHLNFYVIIGFLLLLMTAVFASSFSSIKSYFGFITAFFILSIDYQKFLKYIKYVFIFCFFLTLYEFLTKEFIYEISRVVDGKLIPLNEKFFRGWAMIFRAKGIFEGPLSLTQFAIAVSILFKDNIKMILACLAMAIMSNGRLGIVLTAMLLLIYIIRSYNLVQFMFSKRFIVGAIILFFGGMFFVSKMKQSSIDRFFNMFNFQEKANLGRFHYWTEAVYEYFDYNIVNMIFGNLGYYRTLQGNSAENGWLMILLDGGILSLLFYIVPVLLIIYISIQKKMSYFLFMGVIIIAMIVQTFHSGASANMLFWVIIFSFFLEIKNSRLINNIN